jgi:hypothetical protein
MAAAMNTAPIFIDEVKSNFRIFILLIKSYMHHFLHNQLKTIIDLFKIRNLKIHN